MALEARKGRTTILVRSSSCWSVNAANLAGYRIFGTVDLFCRAPRAIVEAMRRERVVEMACRAALRDAYCSDQSHVRVAVTPREVMGASIPWKGIMVGFQSQSYRVKKPGSFRVVIARIFPGAKVIANIAAKAEMRL